MLSVIAGVGGTPVKISSFLKQSSMRLQVFTKMSWLPGTSLAA
jgi:hypothetical protein